MVTVNEDCILNSPTPIAALTNGIAAVFVPLRSVRLFVLATLAICAAGVMWIACNQSKPSVSAECSQDVQYHWLAESYFKVGEFGYAESMLGRALLFIEFRLFPLCKPSARQTLSCTRCFDFASQSNSLSIAQELRA